MELECVMRLKWLGRLVEDRVDGLLRMMRWASATESGYMGGLFQVNAVAFGPQLGRGPAETLGHYRSPVVNKSAGHNPLHRVAAAR